jgi:NADH dehydrogenase
MILVVGATGSLGGRITRDLRARGHDVRALVRAATDSSAVRDAGAEIVHGDLRDRTSLADACRGAATVVTTASASRRSDDTIDAVDLAGNLNLIDAAVNAGVRHFVFVSTLLATADSPVPLFRAKAEAEARLRASGMAWTALRADAFMDAWFGMLIEMPLAAGRPVTLVGESKGRHSFVAEQDVAAFAVAAVENLSARNVDITIGGPQAITFRDAVTAYENATGRTIPISTIAPGEMIPGLPEFVSHTAAAFDTFDTVVPMEQTARTFGVALTDVHSFARGRAVALNRAFEPS